MASRRQLLQDKLSAIEARILNLEGGSTPQPKQVDPKPPSTLDADVTHLHGCSNFELIIKYLENTFGTKSDDREEKNDLLDTFIEEAGDVNFYSYSTLMLLDESPGSDVASYRSIAKLVLLPCFQVLVPLFMIWYFIVEKDLFGDQGYCCNHTNIIFRGTGFVAFTYSGWQIIDGDNDPSAKFFLKHSARQYAITGGRLAWKGTWMFFLGNLTQQLCSTFLLILTYIVFTSQCDTPLDLLMNCVAINFVLDIDIEWMNESQQAKSQSSAQVIWKAWRDVAVEYEGEIKQKMTQNQAFRRSLPATIEAFTSIYSTCIWVGTYILIFGWFFCPPSW